MLAMKMELTFALKKKKKRKKTEALRHREIKQLVQSHTACERPMHIAKRAPRSQLQTFQKELKLIFPNIKYQILFDLGAFQLRFFKYFNNSRI